MATNKLILRSTPSPYAFPVPDTVKGSPLSWAELDNDLIFVKGLNIMNGTYDSGTATLTLNRIDGSLVTITGITGGGSGSTLNTYVSGGTYNGIDTIQFFNTTGGTFAVTGITGGGSGTTSPGGSDSYVQYNALGSFNGTSGLTWNGGTEFNAITTFSGSNQTLAIGNPNFSGLDFAGVAMTYKNPLSGGTSIISNGDLTAISGYDNHNIFGYVDFSSGVVHHLTATPEDGVNINSSDSINSAGLIMHGGDNVRVVIDSTATTAFDVYDSNTGTIRFAVDANGAGVTINDTYTFPNSDGTSGQVLTTDGAGTVSWETVTGGTSPILVGTILYTDLNAAISGTGMSFVFSGAKPSGKYSIRYFIETVSTFVSYSGNEIVEFNNVGDGLSVPTAQSIKGVDDLTVGFNLTQSNVQDWTDGSTNVYILLGDFP